jgi:hypothetical protein
MRQHGIPTLKAAFGKAYVTAAEPHSLTLSTFTSAV